MEVLTIILQAIDSFVTALLIGVSSLLGTFYPTSLPPPPNESTITRPITHTTVSIEAPAASKQAVEPKKESPAPLPIATTQQSPTPPATPSGATIAYEKINTESRAALVNILCIAKSGSGIGSVSGSGVIVDSRGTILTNAHIAQFFLLKDYPSPNSVDCVVRTGSPAEPKYHAELLYLPPAWIEENASQLKAEKPMGTGEHDYAFLRITGTINPEGSLPSSFPALSIAIDDPIIGEEALLAAYPAGFLDGTSIERDLYITSAFTVIQKLFTFDEKGFIDVVSIGGTVVSQGGSSGGAVVRAKDGKVLGLIATATAGATTGDRDLRAIVLSHVNRSLAAQGKGGVGALLAKNPIEEATNFATTLAPGEKEKLIQALTN